MFFFYYDSFLCLSSNFLLTLSLWNFLCVHFLEFIVLVCILASDPLWIVFVYYMRKILGQHIAICPCAQVQFENLPFIFRPSRTGICPLLAHTFPSLSWFGNRFLEMNSCPAPFYLDFLRLMAYFQFMPAPWFLCPHSISFLSAHPATSCYLFLLLLAILH